MKYDPVALAVAVVFGLAYVGVLVGSAISSGRRRVDRAIAQALPPKDDRCRP